MANKPNPAKDDRTVVVATRITQDMYDQLTQLAKDNFRSVAAEILFAINSHLILKLDRGRMQK